MKISPAGIKRSTIIILILASCVLLIRAVGSIWGRAETPQPAIVHVISEEEGRSREAGLLADLDLVTRERNGLLGALDRANARIRGLELLIADTVLKIQGEPVFIDTAMATVVFDIRKGLQVDYGVARDSAGRYRKEIAITPSAAGCEKVTVRGGQTSCSRPPFGHAELVVRAGVSSMLPTSLQVPDSLRFAGELALRLTPSLVSPWALETSIDRHRRWETFVERALRLW